MQTRFVPITLPLLLASLAITTAGFPDEASATPPGTIHRDFEAWLSQTTAGLDGAFSRPGGAQALASDPAGQTLLAQAELLRACGPEKVWLVASKTNAANTDDADTRRLRSGEGVKP